MAAPRSRARRGLDKSDILNAAFDLFDREGEEGFSVRKVGASLGIDPMSVLHHFHSKEELMRQIADQALASVSFDPPGLGWKDDLRHVARSYRDLARRHPNVFHLHFRFHATGPADHRSSEIVYRALLDARLPETDAAGLGLAFYAFVLGLGLAETGGLLQPVEGAERDELLALDGKKFPSTRALVPAFQTLDPDRAFAAAVTAFIDGIEHYRTQAWLRQAKLNAKSGPRGGSGK